MKRRKKRSREEWVEIIGRQERSGLAARAFCQGEGIGLASFYQRRRRLREGVSGSESGMDSKEAFIDMGPIGASGVSTSADVSPWAVTLDLGEGVRLTLQRG